MTETAPPEDRRSPTPKELRLGKRRVALPRHAWARIAIGTLLVIGGLFGILPVLGFWMIPIGIAVLAADIPAADRLRRRMLVWMRGLRRRWRQRGG